MAWNRGAGGTGSLVSATPLQGSSFRLDYTPLTVAPLSCSLVVLPCRFSNSVSTTALQVFAHQLGGALLLSPS